jgi:hypothetical protein
VGRWKILYRRRPAWLTGEDERDRDARARLSDLAALALDEAHYPGDYAGFVVSVIPADRDFTAAELADPNRAVVELDLDAEGLAALRRRESRILAGRPEPVTFEHRWGAIAPVLRRNFEDPEAVERVAEDADAERHEGTDAWRFVELVELARRSLAPNVVHSGAGLYEVGPGKTYSTIQSALDQLWTDQGGATFTEIQYIRIFAGTYTEDCTANSGFVMDAQNGYFLVIEGDPAGDRANVIVQPPTQWGIRAYDQIEVRHLTIDGVNLDQLNDYGIIAAGYLVRVRDCAITMAYGHCVLSQCSMTYLEDCALTENGLGRCFLSNHESVARRCVFVGNNGNKTQSQGFETARGSLRVEACTFRDFLYAVRWCATPADYDIGHLDLRNCSFYNCGQAVRVHSRPAHVLYANLINNAFKGVDYVIRTQVWPDETTEAGIHGPWTLRNNCLDYDVAFAWNDADTKTLAQFAAFDRVDSSGNKDATDPLLTDPGAGDFSLASDSPCRRAGHGSGVLYDIDGAAYDPYHPDIGAVSTGVGEAPIIISADAANPAPNDGLYGPGDTITLLFDTDTNESTAVTGTKTGTEMDALFTLSNSHTFGDGTDSFSLAWSDIRTLVITVLVANAADVALGDTITIQSSADIKNDAETSEPSTATSGGLTGDWGILPSVGIYLDGGADDMGLGKKDKPLYDDFTVANPSGDLITGLVQGDFTILLYDPTETEVSGSVPVTITELGFGNYRLTFTPNLVGDWLVIISNVTYFRWGQRRNYQVYASDFDDLGNLGPGNRVVEITVKDSVTTDPVPAVWTEVWNATSTTRIAFGYTDSNGEITFQLYDGSYKVYLSKIGQYVFTVPEDLTVSASPPPPDVEVEYIGVQFVAPTPPSPELCMVYGWEQDAQGVGLAVDVVASIVGDTNLLLTNPHINASDITVTSDPAHGNGPGYWEMALLPSTDFVPGETVYYTFTINGKEIGTVLVPDTASAALKELLDP